MKNSLFTNTQKLNAIIEFLTTAEIPEELSGVPVTDIVDMLNKNLASAEKKSANAKAKAAEKSKALEGFKADVLSVLTEDFMTRDEITAKVTEIEGVAEKYGFEEITVQRVGSRLTALIEDGAVVKADIKKGNRTLVGYKRA